MWGGRGSPRHDEVSFGSPFMPERELEQWRKAGSGHEARRMTKVWDHTTQASTHTTHSVVVMSRVATSRRVNLANKAQENVTLQRVSM